MSNKAVHKDQKLTEGMQVHLCIPFQYTIGEEGPVTGTILKTITDCKNEIRAELNGYTNPDELYIETIDSKNLE